MTNTGTQPLTQHGDTITHRAGVVTITLTWIREDTYRVTTYTGSHLNLVEVPAWTETYDDEATARTEARRIAVIFADGKRPEDIPALVDDLMNQRHRNNSRRPFDPSADARFAEQIEALNTLWERAYIVGLRAELRASFDRAYPIAD